MSIESMARAIGLELNEWQQKAVEATAWYYDIIGGRGSGRTTLLILGAFNMALSQPCTPVYIIDHFDNPRFRYRRESLVKDWAHIIATKLMLNGDFVITGTHERLAVAFVPTPPVYVEVERLENSER